jgi:hypothetical protein
VAGAKRVKNPIRSHGPLPGRRTRRNLSFGDWIWRYDIRSVGSSEADVTLTSRIR